MIPLDANHVDCNESATGNGLDCIFDDINKIECAKGKAFHSCTFTFPDESKNAVLDSVMDISSRNGMEMRWYIPSEIELEPGWKSEEDRVHCSVTNVGYIGEGEKKNVLWCSMKRE